MPETEKDLKPAGSSGAGNGQPAEDDKGKGATEEDTITLPKKEYEQIISDRDNYKTGLLGKKAGERELSKKPDVVESNNNGGSGASVDVAKIAKETSAMVLADLAKTNESKAKLKFLKEHPEYVDDARWGEFIGHFASKRGKASIEDILEDMEDAVLTHKRSTGQLDKYLEEEREKARRRGEIDARMSSGGNAGGVGDTSGQSKDKQALTPEGEAMTRQFKNDPKVVAKVGKEDFTINILK